MRPQRSKQDCLQIEFIYIYIYIYIYMNVQTNIGREFLNLVSKHFPKKHRYNKIFNKNTVKVSYSCTDNLQTIIKKHNRKILETTTNTTISTEKIATAGKRKITP